MVINKDNSKLLLRTAQPDMALEFDSIAVTQNCQEYETDAFIPITIQILLQEFLDEEDDITTKEIGAINAYIIRDYAHLDCYAFDCESADLESIYPMLIKSAALLDTEEDEDPMLAYPYIYIDRITIDPEYRSEGIGTHVLKSLETYYYALYHNDLGGIILNACPIEEKRGTKAFSEGRKRLIKFYENCGFKRVNVKDKSNCFMIKVLLEY